MKNYLLLLMLVVCTSALSAQISVGLSGGMNFTTWKWEIDNNPTISFDYHPAFGWRAAALAETALNKQLSLRAELGTQVYANGEKKSLVFPSDILSGDLNGSQYRYRENYQYWEASVLAEIKPFRKASWFYLVAGATGGKLTKGWTTYKALEPDKEQIKGSDIDVENENWHHNSFAADMGLGGNIRLNQAFKLKLESRFLYFFNEMGDLDYVHSRISPVMLNLGCVYTL